MEGHHPIADEMTSHHDQAPPAYPNLSPGNEGSSANEKVNGGLSKAQETASNTMSSISNSQTAQSLSNGPMADKARSEAATTKTEFSNLAASRQTPSTQTATGQNLTHYHSLFYSLLSWENPRATAISFVSIVSAILLARYVPVDRYVLKAAFTVLGITAAAEVAGQLALGEGFVSKIRPRKYYTIPRETLESVLGDIEELVNFFVIEFQRIIFAENIYATIGAFFFALLGYFLVKVTPKWGLLLLSTCTIYLAPLIYIKNKDLIDSHLSNASELVNSQTQQFRSLAATHTNKAFDSASTATSSYVAKAQEMMGGAKKSAVDQGYVSKETADKAPGVPVDGKSFPAAPKTEPAPSVPQTDPAAPAAVSALQQEHAAPAS